MTCILHLNVNSPCMTTLQYYSGSCRLTPELLTAGGAVGRLVVAHNSIAGLWSLIVWTQSGRKHNLLAVCPLLSLLGRQRLREAKHQESRAKE